MYVDREGKPGRGVRPATAEQAAEWTPTVRQALGDPDAEARPGETFVLPPCVPEDHLEAIARDTKGARRCPRIALDEDNVPAAELVQLTIAPHTRDLFGKAFDVMAAAHGWDAQEQLAQLQRVTAVVHSPAVTARAYPRPQEPQREGRKRDADLRPED